MRSSNKYFDEVGLTLLANEINTIIRQSIPKSCIALYLPLANKFQPVKTIIWNIGQSFWAIHNPNPIEFIISSIPAWTEGPSPDVFHRHYNILISSSPKHFQ